MQGVSLICCPLLDTRLSESHGGALLRWLNDPAGLLPFMCNLQDSLLKPRQRISQALSSTSALSPNTASNRTPQSQPKALLLYQRLVELPAVLFVRLPNDLGGDLGKQFYEPSFLVLHAAVTAEAVG